MQAPIRPFTTSSGGNVSSNRLVPMDIFLVPMDIPKVSSKVVLLDSKAVVPLVHKAMALARALVLTTNLVRRVVSISNQVDPSTNTKLAQLVDIHKISTTSNGAVNVVLTSILFTTDILILPMYNIRSSSNKVPFTLISTVINNTVLNNMLLLTLHKVMPPNNANVVLLVQLMVVGAKRRMKFDIRCGITAKSIVGPVPIPIVNPIANLIVPDSTMPIDASAAIQWRIVTENAMEQRRNFWQLIIICAS